jgi:hypothetical protein
MDRINWRTGAGMVLSAGFLGRVAAPASEMHNPRAMQARSRSIFFHFNANWEWLLVVGYWLLVAGGWWLL